MKSLLAFVALLFASVAVTSSSQASLINLTQGYPDIFSAGVSVTYNAGTDAFNLHGQSLTLTQTDLTVHTITSGVFDISMTVATGGVISPGGTIAITGTVPDVGATSGTLLQGTITQIGYSNPPGGNIFEFLFTATGGDLLPAGAHGGVVVDSWNAKATGFNGSFDANFSNTAAWGVADAYLPEPATMAFLAFGATTLALCRRLSNARKR
jgi:hypothetical protein